MRRDGAGASGTLTSPLPDSLADVDQGFVEVQWDDDTGTNTESYDVADVTITGVSIDRTEDLGDGRVRYWYNDDGDRLRSPEVRVAAAEGAVTDIAGNASAELAASFQFIADMCYVHNDDSPKDTNFDGNITALDALHVINHLNRDLENTVAEMESQALPGFDVDVNCDGEVTAQDALLVINQLARDGLAARDEVFADF